MSDALLDSLASGLDQMRLQVTAQQQQQLIDYVQLLARWNRIHNLTAVKSPPAMVTRHLLDSLSISPYLRGDSLLDVGAGAGLPGIPLAITHPQLQVTLVDRVSKKTQFMSIAASTLGLGNVQVVHTRIEALGGEPRFAMVTARAFAEVDVLCRLCQPWLAADGRVLAMIGKALDHEQMESLRRLTAYTSPENHKLCVPGEQGDRNLVILQRCEAPQS
ncbi:MAG: 16S rRNA (guanine(527)-N(7))-methyltransferase RsmG [Pseudomonadota bacterium]